MTERQMWEAILFSREEKMRRRTSGGRVGRLSAELVRFCRDFLPCGRGKKIWGWGKEKRKKLTRLHLFSHLQSDSIHLATLCE